MSRERLKYFVTCGTKEGFYFRLIDFMQFPENNRILFIDFGWFPKLIYNFIDIIEGYKSILNITEKIRNTVF